ncbi:lysosomal Pro-X carboxypeptidase [Vespula maculifrons]|uniref:Lysosomal Pro-X carboxypeptidase n=1 Tax=Vespula maculifrons TaxID=7453 RepID=A0ABD2BB88_VESMC
MKQKCILIFSVIIFFLSPPALQLKLSNRFHIRQMKKGRHINENGGKYKYEIKTFEVPVDHFSFAVKDKFNIRYLVNDTWQRENNAPIFFYTGNEGDIEVFAENTGFMWEIAPEFGATVIFAEHRYYGESMPFGNKSLIDPAHWGYLTSQQAIADYVDLIEHLRSDENKKHSPVIVFGGSYGGMLSSWMRMKYPHIVQGAIAASAPILQFTGVSSCESFARITTSSYRAACDTCPKLIQRSWNVITNVTSNDEGKKWLSENWKLCQPLTNSTHVEELQAFLEDVYGTIAMVNYPYETNFIVPLPPNPVKVFCNHLSNKSLTGKPLLTALYKALNVFTNYTGQTNCTDIENASGNLDALAWDYQACSEIFITICSDGVNDMFRSEPWDIKKISEDCLKKHGAHSYPYMVCKEYGCKDLSTATNIVFSNGLLDPWSGGGVLWNLSSSATAVIIPEGAHHIDLRGSNPRDPYSVILARKYHRYYIKQWIKQYKQQKKRILVT